MDIFRVRLNCIDHYQATPIKFDPPVPQDPASENAITRPKVSVIRVFGATDTGQKVLMHVHGAFQYLYIEYSGGLASEEVDFAIRTLHLSIDHALAISYRKNIYEGKHFYVAHISLVKGVPFYGYHVGYKFYLKIYLLNPLHMTRLADLLREGAVMKRTLQPFESHMQYLAQWMCDYNLFGCGYIDCAKVNFRGPVPRYLELKNALHRWHDRSIPPELVSDESVIQKQSHCSIEVDLCVQDIINRHGVQFRALHHDFIERMKPLSLDVKLVPSMAGLWKDETRRRKARMGISDAESSPFPAEALISMSADPRNSQPGGWIHEDEYRAKVAELAAEERSKVEARRITFEHFVKNVPLETMVKTAWESVEDLYPTNLCNAHMNGLLHPATQVLVDETRIFETSKENLSDSDDVTVAKTRPVAEGPATNRGSDESASSGKENPMSESNLTPPISSSEFEKLGIRKHGDFSHIEEDKFVMPPEYISREPTFPPRDKRTYPEEYYTFKQRKKSKLLKDEGALLPDLRPDQKDGLAGSLKSVPIGGKSSFDMSPSVAEKMFSDGDRSTVTERVSMQTKTQARPFQTEGEVRKSSLSFPVVKDPHDANTILRLSQRSSSSSRKQSPNPSQNATHETFAGQQALSGKTTQYTTISAATTSSLKSPRRPNVRIRGLQNSSPHTRLMIFQQHAPRMPELETEMHNEELPTMVYQEAYYSNQDDVPDRSREYAGREFKLESDTVLYLPDFDPTGRSAATFGRKMPILIDQTVERSSDRKRRRLCKISQWSIAEPPPAPTEVITWLDEELQKEKVIPAKAVQTGAALSQIDNPTQKNKFGFKYSQKQASTSVHHETQYMSIMSLELHVNTRGQLSPNPEVDEVSCIFWCVQSDDEDLEVNGLNKGTHVGILALASEPGVARKISQNIAVEVEEEFTELDLLTKLIDIVRHYDPDILTGYEVHNSSWGYLIERARFKYDYNFCNECSRMKSQSHGRFGKDDDKWGFNHTSTIRITGRHTINIWRAMRGELNLLQYTMENVVFHLLHRRIPHYKFADLTAWYKSRHPRDLAKVIDYFVSRVQMDLEILDSNELVARTSEQARLLGVDWFSVISRGSQFKVESLMFRIAKPENFLLVSPSRRQVGGQNALECLPLVMEPQSDFYTSPMLVLDFQSLYPSVMIAYNYCYSTFLGRVVSWRGVNKMGFTDYRREQGLLELLKDQINIAPNGIMYAKTEIRKSLLAKMLSEILETRVMVKSGMKVDKDDKTLQRLLNNRQLALKLIANVTYGYTSASFSGRMPCSEIADSIVQTARETLERAIALIHSVERWGAEVVYGDTDSVFVYLKGRTRDQAFNIGEEIAEMITEKNPRPVKLKFEKVYHPCVLLAKKRYVGFKYESRHQKEPEFEAKGIETVRRDGTPAEQKVEENALKILFRTTDLSQVKTFFQEQCSKIMKGRVSIQDFCFAREVKLGTYSDKGPPPPGALISARRMLEDPRLEPQYGERVPYVVVTGGPGARLIDRCVAPDVLLQDAQSELDAEYYISKNLIPPLERIFNLVGANVRQWYDEMPKYQRIRRVEVAMESEGKDVGLAKKTLESYMKSSICVVCREPLDTESPVCNSCFDQAPQAIFYLRAKLARAERKAAQLAKVCRSCSGHGWNDEVKCDSKDCPVFYSRARHGADLGSTNAQILPVLQVLEEHSQDELAW